MATRYNGGGWYSPYNALRLPQTGTFFKPDSEPYHPPPPHTNNGIPSSHTNMNISSPHSIKYIKDKKEDTGVMNSDDASRLSTLFKYQLQFFGVILCVLAAFCLGLAISNALLLGLSSGDLSCLGTSPILPNIPALAPMSYLLHVIPNFPPTFVFVASIFCMVLKNPQGSLIAYLFTLTLVNIVAIVPVYFIFGILGILHAVNCSIGVVQILKLILPILITIFGFILFLLLIYLATLLDKIKKSYRPFSSTQSPLPEPFNNPRYNAALHQEDIPSFGIAPFSPSTYRPPPLHYMDRHF